jgi:DNA segregation ATPase FtsK/SpoIIIE, S-DNA-T family
MPQKEKTFSKNTIKEDTFKEDTFVVNKTGNPEKKEPFVKSVKKEKTKKVQNGKSDKINISSIIRVVKGDKFQKVSGLFFLLLSFYMLIAFISYLFTWKVDDNIFYNAISRVLTDNSLTSENWMGKIGAVLSYLFIKKWFGVASFLFIIWLLIFGLKLFLNFTLFPLSKATKYTLFGLLWISITMSFFIHSDDLLILGGSFGYQANVWLNSILGKIGTGIVLFFAIFSFLIIEYNIQKRWQKKIKPEEDEIEEEIDGMQPAKNEYAIDHLKIQDDDEDEPDVEFELKTKPLVRDNSESIELENTIIADKVKRDKDNVPFTVNTFDDVEEDEIESIGKTDETKHFTIDTEYDPTLDLPTYKFPTLDMLKEYDSGNIAVQNDELEANKNRILKTLNDYSIQIDKINATIGPTVTLYEIVPAPGVRISKIKNLEDDIALSLSALGIRIIAPMPGKGTIGIEVPNQNPKIVSMRTILASDAFQNNNYDLPIGLGKTISNKSFVADLAKMPHLLMAGATGQGKSVGLNCILTSLLYKKHPSQLKFVLVDPKKVELTLFSKIERHYLAKLPDSEEAIITDIRKVVRTLNSLCIEMDTRYDLLKLAGVRNIKEYNAKFISRKLNPNDGHNFMPYIVLIVDEFADLIITAGKEVETPMARLAQLARAIGIHLIVATQRPSVNVITGTIKANFPARLAYRVISKIDSRTILDSSGADQLIGRGDMLLSTGSEMVRLQCAFVDTPEVEEITDFIGNQRGYPEAFALPECPDEESEAIKNMDPSERDEMFDEAARCIVAHQHGSTSLLQRKLKLGYNRAGRIIDQLESAGIVGPFEGSKARDVRITDMNSLEQFLTDMKNNL